MPIKQQRRTARAISLHASVESAITQTHHRQTNQIPAPIRRNLTRALIDLKKNKEAYGFGPIQLNALDAFILLARKAKTTRDLEKIHRKTCILGLEKH
jgi:hypothetical protein